MYRMDQSHKRHTAFLTGAAVLLAVLVTVTSHADAVGIKIKLKPQAEVESEIVTLGQIADIVCDDPQQRETLGALVIGKSAEAGRSEVIRVDQVELRLKQMGMDQGRYALSAKGPVTVTRLFVSVTEEQIAQAVRTYIYSKAPWKKEQMKIRHIHARRSFKAPSGTVSFQINANRHTDWLGAVLFYVTVNVDGQPVRKVHVSTFIEVWSDIVLAAKPLGRNQPITRDDIRIEKMDLARAPVNALVTADEIIGCRANRPIAMNTILRTDMVEIPPLIKKGDIVHVTAESDRLKVTTRGVAGENGAKGERIRIKNLRSKKTIYALVVDAQTVKADF